MNDWLHSLPIRSFAQRALKNDPWPQSCWIMKMRTSNAPVGSHRGATVVWGHSCKYRARREQRAIRKPIAARYLQL